MTPDEVRPAEREALAGFGADDPLKPKETTRPWYKRWPLWGGVAAAVLIASVVSDLPQHSSQRQKVSTDAAITKQIATGIHDCTYATTQAFAIYKAYTAGTFPAADRSLVPGYLKTDLQACTFANTAIFGMSTITTPSTPAGRDLGAIVTTTLEWATSDAVGAIGAIEVLVSHPHDAKALADLARRERSLASDRALAERQRSEAERALGGAPLPSLGLPVLPSPRSSP